MESVYRNLELNDNYSIIGEKDQALQIILKKGDGIVFKKHNLYYMSSTQLEESLYQNKNSLLNNSNTNNGNEIRVKDNNLIRLKNMKNTFEYVGIFGGGKILFLIISNN
jgi:hypothetical protein